MKKLMLLCLALIMTLSLVGCKNHDDSNGNDKQMGVIIFYSEAVLERTEPPSSTAYEIMDDEKRELAAIIDSVEKWTDDYAVDRLQFYFDGQFSFFGEEKTYYFSYEYNTIYYSHYFADVSPEQMEYIKGLNTGE